MVLSLKVNKNVTSELEGLRANITKGKAEHDERLKLTRNNLRVCQQNHQEVTKQLQANVRALDKDWREVINKACPEVEGVKSLNKYLNEEQASVFARQFPMGSPSASYTESQVLQIEPYSAGGGMLLGAIIVGGWMWRRHKQIVNHLSTRLDTLRERNNTLAAELGMAKQGYGERLGGSVASHSALSTQGGTQQ